MTRRVGYPDNFRFLDDQHEELGAILDRMRREADAATPALRKRAVEFLTVFKAHGREEEAVMAKQRYGDYELHKAHHDHVAGTIETILTYFDRHAMSRYKDEVVRHLENKLSEEQLFDRALAAFLARS